MKLFSWVSRFFAWLFPGLEESERVDVGTEFTLYGRPADLGSPGSRLLVEDPTGRSAWSFLVRVLSVREAQYGSVDYLVRVVEVRRTRRQDR